MANSDLTLERLKHFLEYDPDTGVFKRRVTASGNAAAGRVIQPPASKLRYVRIFIDRVRYEAHRLAWLYVHGEWPMGIIDHINGDKHDNRIENLRDVTHSINRENQRRVRSDNLSAGITGVSWCAYHSRFKAHIRIDGKLKHLKYCRTREEAEQVYLRAKLEHHEGYVAQAN